MNTSSNSWIAIPVVLGIFFVIVAIFGAKWYIIMKKVKESDLQAIRDWAQQRGLYEKGDPKTQTVKLQ